MALLPSIASYSSNIADYFTKPLSRHQFDTLIGDAPAAFTPLSTSVASTVDLATVVATATVVAPPTSDSVPHPAPYFVDTGASLPVAPSCPDFALEIAQAPYGLIRSAFDTSVASDSILDISVASDSKAYSKVASTPVDPYTLITGEDTATVDLSFPDSDSVDTVEFASTLVYSLFRQFGTATLIFLSDANSKLITILVEPTQVDWIHWVPLPRLTPTESYFHIFGRDYLQAITFFHLIPIWIYFLLHFVVNLED